MIAFSGKFFDLLAITAALALCAGTARAVDQEGCLNCHQYRGLARISEDKKTIEHFYVDANYYNRGLGPHARLKCTDCHTRAEVEVFPHKKQTPVDCGQVCHLDNGKMEVRFSHKKVSDMVGGSVHSMKTLRKSNELLGSPLREGQALCLLCHDEPRFAKAQLNWIDQDAPVSRCNTCHDEQLPVDTTFSYWHVHSRSQRQRSALDTIKECGLCHANSKIQKEFNKPDTIASYAASFHGKAVLLGSKETASCLDCHVSSMQNAHQIEAKTNVTSPTNPQQLGDTCRTPNCHPEAGAQISSAAIHLNLPTSRGVEYFVACVFVALIVFTFGPSLAIACLKLLGIILGREDKDHHHHMDAAHELLKKPEAKAKLKRFNLHQRFQHWYLVFTFASLCITGFPIKFAAEPWAAKVVGVIGSVSRARLLHRVAGVMLVAGFLYHLGYVGFTILRTRKKTGQSWFKIVWDLPMMVKPQDGLAMMGMLLYCMGLKKERPLAGRFNAEEKFEYIGVFWGSFVLGTTGILMWFNAWTSRHMAGRILTIALLVHTFEAFLALLHVGIVHLAGVIFSPGVFPASPAMFTGNTPTEELVEGHRLMLAEVEKEFGGNGHAPAGHPTTPEAPHA
jgi:cytochrome b subunit of formate dehydrogenase